MPVTITMTDHEAEAVKETLNRAFDDIPKADTRRFVDRVTSRIEKALKAQGRG